VTGVEGNSNAKAKKQGTGNKKFGMKPKRRVGAILEG
jgi:hypothetical protein